MNKQTFERSFKTQVQKAIDQKTGMIALIDDNKEGIKLLGSNISKIGTLSLLVNAMFGELEGLQDEKEAQIEIIELISKKLFDIRWL